MLVIESPWLRPFTRSMRSTLPASGSTAGRTDFPCAYAPSSAIPQHFANCSPLHFKLRITKITSCLINEWFIWLSAMHPVSPLSPVSFPSPQFWIKVSGQFNFFPAKTARRCEVFDICWVGDSKIVCLWVLGPRVSRVVCSQACLFQPHFPSSHFLRQAEISVWSDLFLLEHADAPAN